jgi:2-C-methyl-D-erythritol 4-phosphate cytidylyltransferase
MRAVALLLGAGRGRRLAGSVPKCFVEVAGKPLLAYAVEAVTGCPSVEGFVVAAPAGSEAEAARIAEGSPKRLAVVAGGNTRQASVSRALEAVPRGFDVVVCHDVARPFAGRSLFTAVLNALDGVDGAVPVVPITDTLKRVNPDGVAETLPRDGLVMVQTPQAFRRDRLEAAHRLAAAERYVGTDDAVLVERAGFRVVVVPGDPANLKITSQDDLRVAGLLARVDG